MSLFNFIKSHISIIDVINEYTTLKKIGSTYWKACCPFHHEKTPSFTVSPDKGIYYCFGCHAHGDVISFVAQKENVSQFQAVQHMIEKYNIAVPTEIMQPQGAGTNKEERERYFELCKLVAYWASENLQKNSQALAYLEERNITKSSIEKFTIGYFPKNSLQDLCSYISRHNFSSHDLVEAHIIGQQNNSLYSSFEQRIIFPIRDHLGRFCGFGGRIFMPHDERVKYYNSKETAYFHKGTLLFGMDQAKQSIQKHNAVCLVEGYTDTVAMHQYGYTNAVATLGTACTLEHIKQMSRYASRLFVIFDGDKAGLNAMLRIAQFCWQVDMDIKIIQLPQGYDPATYLQEHHQAFNDLIKQAQDIFSFYVAHAALNFEHKGLKDKMQASHEILELIDHMQDPLKKDILLLQASEILQIPLDILRSQKIKPQQQFAQPAHEQQPEQANTPAESTHDMLERKIIGCLLHEPQLLTAEHKTLLLSGLEGVYLAIAEYIAASLERKPAITAHELQELAPEELHTALHKLLFAVENYEIHHNFAQLVLQFQKKHWKTIVGNIKIKLQSANKSEAEQLLQYFQNLKSHLLKSGRL